MNVRRCLAIALAVIVVIGCSSSAPSSPSPSATPPVEETAWQRALNGIDENGQFSLDAALALFATAFGPLPGVDAQYDISGVSDRTIAIRAVNAHRDELTAEQRAAIEEYLEPPEDATLIVIPPVADSARGAVLGALTATQEDGIRLIATQFRGLIAQNLGRDFLGETNIHFMNKPGPKNPYTGGLTPADASSDWPGGVFGDCNIRLFTGATESPGYLNAMLAHEIFHCFQMDGYRAMTAFATAPAWVVEGQASWVSAYLTENLLPVFDWNPWLQTQIRLTKRTYDAIGFYAHLEETGTDPWSVFLSMWDGGSDNTVIFNQAGANNDKFLDSWASSVLRERGRGEAWDTTGPGITTAAFSPLSHVLAPDGSIDISSPFFNTLTQFVNLEVDAVHFQSNGHVRVSDGNLDDGGLDTTDVDDVWFCVEGRDCSDKCETDDDEPPPIDGTIGYVVAVASTGGIDGTIGRMTGIKLKEDCESPSPSRSPTPRPTEPPDPCDSGCPMSNGDVHIVTIDDHSYDFQAVGEFVLLRTPDGSFEIQGRQEGYSGSNDISINTAIAMRVEGHRVGVYGKEDTDDSLTILVDGALVDPTVAPVMVGGATITFVDGIFPAYEVALPDGTRISLAGQLQYGLNLTINPSESIREGVVGLMGPVEPGSMGVPALPDGTVIPEQLGDDAYYEQLYGVFEDSWRVTAETSLFDYTDGRTTESYINPFFPVLDEIVTLDQLTPEQIAFAEAACSGITIEFLRQQCIYDVAVTGVDLYSDLYDISAEVVDRGTIKPAGQQVRIVNLFWDPVTGAVPLDVYAWTDAGAALVTSVPYGEASEFFDPGSRSLEFGGAVLVSLQRAGAPVAEEAFNLADLRMDVEPGLRRTYVVSAGEENPIFGGLQASFTTHDEERKDGFGMLDPLPDRGLLFLDIEGFGRTHDPVDFYLSAGDGCLTQPGFETLPQQSGVAENSWGYQGPLAVTPGSNLELTLHAVPENDDPFAQLCDSPPIAGPFPFSLQAGERSHLILHAIPGDPTVRSMILPFGDE